MSEVKGYKVFNPDWTCRGFQYEVGKIFEEDVKPSCCDRGFHFCEKAADCFSYYSFNSENRVAEVIAQDSATPGTATPGTGTNLLSILVVLIQKNRRSRCSINRQI